MRLEMMRRGAGRCLCIARRACFYFAQRGRIQRRGRSHQQQPSESPFRARERLREDAQCRHRTGDAIAREYRHGYQRGI